MATQDFISPQKIDRPRHEQNMPEGIETPAPESWLATRPGDDISNSNFTNSYRGYSGPNIGYALKLVKLVLDDLVILKSENKHDVEALLSEIAMRRAAHFGRAPIKDDVIFAANILGYLEEPSQGEEKWRPILVHDCAHDEHRRRKIVNSVPDVIIEGKHGEVQDYIFTWWDNIKDLF
ncbi:MAG: hypothetical protein U0R17_02580 [Acidimicrobiia bacterium]